MSATSKAAPSNWQREVARATSQRPSLSSAHWALGRALTVLLAGCAGVSGLKVLLDLYGVLLVNSWKADPSNILASDAQHFDALTRAFALLGLLVLMATGICTMTWLFQAYGSREADPALLPYQRWWTIGAWLIPVVCLVRPFQLLRDLYRATTSTHPQEQELPEPGVKDPSRFGWWWACFVIGNLLSNITASLIVGQTDLGSPQVALSLDLITQLILIAAAVLFIGVLSSITANLRSRATA
jgi:hypothetical protein